jgi:hypothetical protein
MIRWASQETSLAKRVAMNLFNKTQRVYSRDADQNAMRQKFKAPS